MKVIVAMDSFKGSLSSLEAGSAVKKGILAAHPDAVVVVKPLADGGEGTVDALTDGLNGKRIPVTVTGPAGIPVSTYYGYLAETETAVMEIASVAGITLTDRPEPLKATTTGVGEMVFHAAEHGIRNFIIGLGGSCTNDGGIGMLKALGFHFIGRNGQDTGEGAAALSEIYHIEPSEKQSLLMQCRFQIACDVTNPLYGPNGATFTYGPQKGIPRELLQPVDSGMKNYARITEKFSGKDYSQHPGAGAAGGLGFAFSSYLDGTLTSGIQLVLETIRLEDELADADIVVTGEGCLDNQTVMGKAVGGVACIAKKYHAKTIAFAGSIGKGASSCNAAGIDAYFPVLRKIVTLSEAMKPETAAANIAATAEQVFRLI